MMDFEDGDWHSDEDGFSDNQSSEADRLDFEGAEESGADGLECLELDELPHQDAEGLSAALRRLRAAAGVDGEQGVPALGFGAAQDTAASRATEEAESAEANSLLSCALTANKQALEQLEALNRLLDDAKAGLAQREQEVMRQVKRVKDELHIRRESQRECVRKSEGTFMFRSNRSFFFGQAPELSQTCKELQGQLKLHEHRPRGWRREECHALQQAVVNTVKAALSREASEKINNADLSAYQNELQRLKALTDREALAEGKELMQASSIWVEVEKMMLAWKRGSIECRNRWLENDDPAINKADWSVDEDKMLLSILSSQKSRCWISAAEKLDTARTPVDVLKRYQTTLNKDCETSGKWTAEEDRCLSEALEKCGHRDWTAVSKYLSARQFFRAPQQCLQRSQRVALKSDAKRGKWSAEEDEELRQAMKRLYPEGAPDKGIDWKLVSSFVPGRDRSQSRDRWTKWVDPSIEIHKNWTSEEDQRLQAAVEELKSQSNEIPWAQVARKVGNRNNKQCRCRYTILQKNHVVQAILQRTVEKMVLPQNGKGWRKEQRRESQLKLDDVQITPETQEAIDKERSRIDEQYKHRPEASSKRVKQKREKTRNADDDTVSTRRVVRNESDSVLGHQELTSKTKTTAPKSMDQKVPKGRHAAVGPVSTEKKVDAKSSETAKNAARAKSGAGKESISADSDSRIDLSSGQAPDMSESQQNRISNKKTTPGSLFELQATESLLRENPIQFPTSQVGESAESREDKQKGKKRTLSADEGPVSKVSKVSLATEVVDTQLGPTLESGEKNLSGSQSKRISTNGGSNRKNPISKATSTSGSLFDIDGIESNLRMHPVRCSTTPNSGSAGTA